MSPPNLAAPPATRPSPDEIPTFAELAADPEIAPLLSFEPVVRKIRRPDGWTEELQRELIARLAATGTIQAAVWQMGKHATGAEALYKTPTAGSFRASWDAAVAIGRRRNGLDSQPPFAGPVPGIARRGSSAGRAGMAANPDDDDAPEMEEGEKLQLVGILFDKWLGKVEAEREARLAGNVVAADFYLRQITFFEVAFDLMSEGFGHDAFSLLSELRRGDESVLTIAATPFSQLLDEKRRELWAKMGEPDRPEHPPARYLVSKPGFLLESEYQALAKEQKELPPRDQQQCLKGLWAEEAERQLIWEQSKVGPSAEHP